MSHEPSVGSFDNQVLDADGSVVAPERVPDLPDEAFVDMYRWMRFDERGVSLQRQGPIGTFSALTGHEAGLVGSEAALRDDDWLVPYYRDHAATMANGLPPGAHPPVLHGPRGRERGSGGRERLPDRHHGRRPPPPRRRPRARGETEGDGRGVLLLLR